MEVTAATIAVAHPLEVETKSKVAAITGEWYVDSLAVRCINGTMYPEPWPNLKLRGQTWVLFCRLLLLASLLQ